MSKKNLDKLFKEKFKDFSEVPDENVWVNISNSLDAKDKKKRIIPFWLKLGGVAALLAVAIYVFNPFDSVTEASPEVTDVEKTKDSTPANSKDPLLDERIDADQGVVDVTSDTHVEGKRTSDEDEGLNQGISNSTQQKEKITNRNVSVPRKGVVSIVKNDSKSKSEEKTVFTEKNIDETLNNKEKGIAISQDQDVKNEAFDKNNAANNVEKSPENAIVEKQDEVLIAQNQEITLEKDSVASKKKSIFDEIAGQEAEDQIAKSDKNQKWSVGANVAPVYFSSFGEGSPIHSIFVPNSKSGNINLSYGLSVAYELSEKLSIRSGISKVDYGYDTNEIEFTSAMAATNSLVNDPSSGQIDNIRYTARSQDLVVTSKASATAIPQKEAAFDVAGKSVARDGVMGQQFGYIEVPVELDYALVDKRFGVNLIGGISSLFLVDNSVSLRSDGLTTEMGEANNLNAVNFSGNVGFGVNYKFTPKIRFNVEPVFKYQLNTFSNTDGTFQPFSVGVYSGLNFRF